MAAARGTVDRWIRFYRVDVGEDEQEQPLPFDARAALTELRDVVQDSPYLDLYNGDQVSCYDIELRAPPRVMFGKKRSPNRLPHLEDARKLSSWNLRRRPTDVAHVVFFPRNIVGLEANRLAPGRPLIERFLFTKLEDMYEDLSLRALYHPDAYELLGRTPVHSGLTFKIRFPTAARAAELKKSRWGPLGVLSSMIKGREIELTFSPVTRSNQRLEDLDEAAAELQEELMASESEIELLAMSALIRQEGEPKSKARRLNLMDAALADRRTITTRGGNIESESAYSAILKAHKRFKDIFAKGTWIER